MKKIRSIVFALTALCLAPLAFANDHKAASSSTVELWVSARWSRAEYRERLHRRRVPLVQTIRGAHVHERVEPRRV